MSTEAQHIASKLEHGYDGANAILAKLYAGRTMSSGSEYYRLLSEMVRLGTMAMEEIEMSEAT